MHTMENDRAKTQRLLALLRGLGSLGFFGTTKLRKDGQRTNNMGMAKHQPSLHDSCVPSVVYEMLCRPSSTILTENWSKFVSYLKKSCPYSNQPIFGFEFLLGCLIVVNQSKPCASSTSKLGSKTESDYARFISLIQSSEFLRQFVSRNIGMVRVKDVDDKLASRQETIRYELSCAEGDRGVSLEEQNESNS